MIKVEELEFEELKTYMKVARMQHSMIYIEEKDQVLAVGGEDENGSLIDSCESYSVREGTWKMLNTLNQRTKNVGLCKFTTGSKKDQTKPIWVYAFGKLAIERIELTKVPVSPRWEELIVRNFSAMPQATMSLKYDDNLILVLGGIDENNSNS